MRTDGRLFVDLMRPTEGLREESHQQRLVLGAKAILGSETRRRTSGEARMLSTFSEVLVDKSAGWETLGFSFYPWHRSSWETL